MRFYSFRFFFAAFGLAFLLTACTRSSPAALEVGQQAPHFVADSLAGTPFRFPEDSAGKVVLIRFWAERCPHCEAEMKALEALYQQRKGEGFVMLAVNAGQPKEKAEAFARRLELSYAVLLDEDNSLGKRYGVTGVPTSYMVDRGGIVRAKFVGQTAPGEFEKSAQALLAPTP